MTAADKYFLTAKDYYPYNMEEAIQALEYGLACDDEHAGLLTLKGVIYYKSLKEFDAARECFELALFYDAQYVDAYYAYLRFALIVNDLAKVAKLIAAAKQVQGINMARVLYSEALLLERQGKYRDAVQILKKAKALSYSTDSYCFFGAEMERIDTKNRQMIEYNAQVNIIIT